MELTQMTLFEFGPEKKTIYTSSLNVETLEWERRLIEVEDNWDDFSSQNPGFLEGDMYDKACYDSFADDSIYVESWESQEKADSVVLDFARQMRDKFQRVLDKHLPEGE